MPTHGADTAPVGPVTVKADSLAHDAGRDTFLAEGNVELLWRGSILTADRATFDRTRETALAEGNVALQRGNDLLRGSRLTLDLLTDQGELADGSIFMAAQNLRLQSTKLHKKGGTGYLLEQGTLTTCDTDPPSWRFAASELDVTVEGYAEARHARFYVGEVPVFYFPYLVIPAKRERQSGFLLPRFGNSSKKGFFFDLPWYQVISPSQDLTVVLDVETARGAGLGLDYRYLRPQASDGSLRGFLIYDTDENRFRGDLRLQQREHVTPTLRYAADVLLTTDRNYFEDFGEESGDYNRRLTDSTVSLSWHDQRQLLAAEARLQQELQFPNNGTVLQRLPTLSYRLTAGQLGDFPISAGLTGNLVNFYRDQESRGLRLDLRPYFTANRHTASGLDLSAWGGYQLRLYDASEAGSANGLSGLGMADAGARVGTTFGRTFDVAWGEVHRVRHLTIPELILSHTAHRDQDGLPFFDYDDRVPGGTLLTGAVTNYLTGREEWLAGSPSFRELLALRLSMSYQLAGTRRDLLTREDMRQRFTDLRIEGRFEPVRCLKIGTDSYFDTYRFGFSNTNLKVSYDNDDGISAGFNYHRTHGVTEYLEAKLKLPVLRSLAISFSSRYSIDSNSFIEDHYEVEYRRQCWGVTLAYQHRPGDTSVMVGFTLSGLGSPGKVKVF